ncbi:MAG: hypothetical protein DI569_13305 [Sphingopyxis macrogoltabida]|uniref:Uncharacterized protein n=1 Tax=Sphingopyxis macrogoltabida TaxID=33050 RepID=A0A2W5KYJ3_SPHMC|nr:MAG: hypothetical protein DI569_13305 [Sphingopyxis macrogoltabida]
MNPSVLYFSRWGNAVKALFFLLVAAVAFGVAGAMHRDSAPPAATVRPVDFALPPPPPRRSDPLAPFKIPLLIVAGCAALFYAGRHGLRAARGEVGVKIEGGRLHFHKSYAGVPADLPVADIVEALFDRADRLPGDAPFGARTGARLRHGLHLRYRSGDANGEVRLVDNDFDGGTEQLRRFAAQLDVWRQSAARVAHRD